MKKRIFTLLLAVMLLTSLASCSKQEPEYGTFFAEDGIFQNTAITLSITSQNLVAPVKELEYVLHDNSDYFVDSMSNVKVGIEARDVLEIYQDGAWHKVEVRGEGQREPLYQRVIGDPLERKDRHICMKFYDPEVWDSVVKHYAYLKAGSYRLRVTYWIFTDDENAYIPEEQLEAVAYFTVVAPTE